MKFKPNLPLISEKENEELCQIMTKLAQKKKLVIPFGMLVISFCIRVKSRAFPRVPLRTKSHQPSILLFH